MDIWYSDLLDVWNRVRSCKILRFNGCGNFFARLRNCMWRGSQAPNHDCRSWETNIPIIQQFCIHSLVHNITRMDFVLRGKQLGSPNWLPGTRICWKRGIDNTVEPTSDHLSRYRHYAYTTKAHICHLIKLAYADTSWNSWNANSQNTINNYHDHSAATPQPHRRFPTANKIGVVRKMPPK